MQSSTQLTGIHCKVATQAGVRRFLLEKTEYGVLLTQVCQAFGFQKDDVVIKYVDEEEDLVTMSSDDELRFAVASVVKENILRLRADLRTPVQEDETSSEDYSESESESSAGENASPSQSPKIVLKLKQKQEKLLAKLALFEIAAEKGELKASKAKHQDKIRKKLERISSVLASYYGEPQPAPQPAGAPSLIVEVQPAIPPPAVEVQPAIPPPAIPEIVKQELLRRIEELDHVITGARLAFRQANLLVQLQRANVLAASHEFTHPNPSLQGSPVTKDQILEMKAGVAQAKEKEHAKKAELHGHIRNMNELRKQLKAIKIQEKALKEIEKAARNAAKMQEKANKQACKRQEKDAKRAQKASSVSSAAPISV